MPRHDTPKPHNGGQWTDARKRQFIMSALRRAHCRWPPRYAALKKARIAPNTYVCASCGQANGIKGVQLDHIQPVIDIERGFQEWHTVVERMYVEIDGYRCLCKACHAETTQKQREARKLARKNT